MIAPMEKLVLAGPKGRAKELLQSLQQAGVVHLETLRPEALSAYQLSPEERAELRRWEAVSAGAEHTLSLLGLEAEPARPFPEGLEAAEKALSPIQAHAEGLTRQTQELEEELALAQAYREPLERLSADGQLMAYRCEDFWQCMDTLRDKRTLNQLWADGSAPWAQWK